MQSLFSLNPSQDAAIMKEKLLIGSSFIMLPEKLGKIMDMDTYIWIAHLQKANLIIIKELETKRKVLLTELFPNQRLSQSHGMISQILEKETLIKLTLNSLWPMTKNTMDMQLLTQFQNILQFLRAVNSKSQLTLNKNKMPRIYSA